MARFWTVVNEVLRKSDIILLVLDARNIDETINEEIVNKVKQPLIYVLNKCDLVHKSVLELAKRRFKRAVFVSSKEYHGIRKLKEMIIIEGKRLKVEKPLVGVLGYPNVGKSSVINALNGRGSAKTSSSSGFTKGKQNISAKQFMLVDTPGVIPYREDESIMKGSVDFSKVKDPEDAFYDLLEKFPRLLHHYGVKDLEELAIKRQFLLKKGLPDTRSAARLVLKDWQGGKIKC
ncbi:GTPase [Candidatus Woesearchaeota archaeon]|jgi:ribosome biogenesis GTPase A|nr:GTPase [Candidatus Woesearchaeota archaeon]MBT4368541.1 GTPase [Candidatus Woesearchaeota archaeon]MBT4713030.1 GTPase [Candidatus Woesearchaeota archaeon]MBT6639942.1 GTPase [Candidatus Woesearchaeota archaeon]MBT7134114.1 GTPase [Candidatus Woesearchaeota archaeon]